MNKPATFPPERSATTLPSKFRHPAPPPNARTKNQLQYRSCLVSMVCCLTKAYHFLSLAFCVSQCFSLPPTKLCQKDERVVPGNLSSLQIFCFPVLHIVPYNPLHFFPPLRR